MPETTNGPKGIAITEVIDRYGVNKLDGGSAHVPPGRIVARGTDPNVPVAGIISKDQRFPYAETRSAQVDNAPGGDAYKFEVVWEDYALGDADEKQELRVENTTDDLDFAKVNLYVDASLIKEADAAAVALIKASECGLPHLYLVGPRPDGTGRFVVPRHFLAVVDHHERWRLRSTAYPYDGERPMPAQFIRDGVMVSRDPIRDTEYR